MIFMRTAFIQANKKLNRVIEAFVEAASLEVVLFSLDPRIPRGTLKRFERYYCKLRPDNTMHLVYRSKVMHT